MTALSARTWQHWTTGAISSAQLERAMCEFQFQINAGASGWITSGWRAPRGRC
jgi:hypothetical protein